MVLFKSNRICCICKEFGKHVQLHHLDNDPSNNGENNLAVLCSQCHNDTMLVGGFGRRLSEGQIRMYRDEWISLVARQKALILEKFNVQSMDHEPVIDQTEYHDSILNLYKHISLNNYQSTEEALIVQLIASLPQRLMIISSAAQQQIDECTTVGMVIGRMDIINHLKSMLVELLHYWPDSFFTESTPDSYADKMVYDSARLYHTILEPDGPGTGGSIVGPMTCGLVLDDLQSKIPTIVRSLIPLCSSFNFDIWLNAWRLACGTKST